MNIQQMVSALKSDPQLESEFKTNPAEAIEKYGSPLSSDTWIYRATVVVLGVVGLTTTIGVLAVWGLNTCGFGDPAITFKVPEVLIALGSASIGALAGLLAFRG